MSSKKDNIPERPEDVIRLFRRAVDFWRDLERVFPIENPTKFQWIVNAKTLSDEELVREEKEYWHRVVLAANFRKFATQSEILYLPKVLDALVKLGHVRASHSDVEWLANEFASVHKGQKQLGTYKNGQGKSFSAFQIVDHIIHSLFLHGNSGRLAEIDNMPQRLLSAALWEWLASYRPLLDLLASFVEKETDNSKI